MKDKSAQAVLGLISLDHHAKYNHKNLQETKNGKIK